MALRQCSVRPAAAAAFGSFLSICRIPHAILNCHSEGEHKQGSRGSWAVQARGCRRPPVLCPPSGQPPLERCSDRPSAASTVIEVHQLHLQPKRARSHGGTRKVHRRSPACKRRTSPAAAQRTPNTTASSTRRMAQQQLVSRRCLPPPPVALSSGSSVQQRRRRRLRAAAAARQARPPVQHAQPRHADAPAGHRVGSGGACGWHDSRRRHLGPASIDVGSGLCSLVRRPGRGLRVQHR